MKIAKALFLLFLILSASFVFAQEEGVDETFEEEDEYTSDSELGLYTNMQLPSAEGVESYPVFPHSPEKEFAAGNVHQLLALFHNSGNEYMNITFIEGALVLPTDRNKFVQNFTKQPYFINVPPGTEITLDYFWRPDPMLDPMEIGYIATVYYTSTYGDGNYSTTFFNGTIKIVEPKEDIFAGESFFLYSLILGAIGFFAYTYMGKNSLKVPMMKKTQTKQEEENEWLANTSAAKYKKRKNKGKSKTKGKGKRKNK